MKNKPTYHVLVDFSNYAHTCWWPALAANEADAKYVPEEVFKTNLVGKLRTLDKHMTQIVGAGDYDITFVEDRPSARKLALYPEYKANRVKGEGGPPLALAKNFLKENGYISWCHSPDNEADDAIATLARKLHGEQSVVIVSSDKDLWQLIAQGVDVFNVTQGVFVSKMDIGKKFGVAYPELIPLVKSLWGDTGDNVPNAVPRMQKQLMPYVELSNGTADNFYDLTDAASDLTPRCRELLLHGNHQVFVNEKLVKLQTDCPIVYDLA